MCSSYRDLSAQSGGFAGLVLPLSKCFANRDSEADRVFPGEGISFVDRECPFGTIAALAFGVVFFSSGF